MDQQFSPWDPIPNTLSRPKHIGKMAFQSGSYGGNGSWDHFVKPSGPLESLKTYTYLVWPTWHDICLQEILSFDSDYGKDYDVPNESKSHFVSKDQGFNLTDKLTRTSV